MKEAIWLAIAVLLLALIGMDTGLHVAGMLACSERSEAQQNHSGPTHIGGNAIASRLPDQKKSYGWCTYAIQKQQGIDEWMTGLFSGLKATDILLAVFTMMLVGVGRKQADISDRQREIMTHQANIAAQQTDISEQIRTGQYWPHLMLRDAQFRTLRSQWPAAGAPSAEFTLENVGEKTAVLKFFQLDLFFCNGLPKVPIWNPQWHTTYHLIDPSTHWSDAAPFEDEITEDLEQAMKGFDPYKRDWQFYLVVKTICEDVFGQQHEHAWSGLFNALYI